WPYPGLDVSAVQAAPGPLAYLSLSLNRHAEQVERHAVLDRLGDVLGFSGRRTGNHLVVNGQTQVRQQAVRLKIDQTLSQAVTRSALARVVDDCVRALPVQRQPATGHGHVDHASLVCFALPAVRHAPDLRVNPVVRSHGTPNVVLWRTGLASDRGRAPAVHLAKRDALRDLAMLRREVLPEHHARCEAVQVFTGID